MTRLVIWGVVLLAVGGLMEMSIVQAKRLGNTQGYEPEQPIAYSHKVHAGDNQINCLYCHFAAERGKHAGIPPTQLCMNCHKQVKKKSPEVQKIKDALDDEKPIEWIRVHQLPSFVYFNHSVHVNGGVNCQECHGPVETMDRVRQHSSLTMGWCLDCHRQRDIAPPNTQKAATGGDCARCHY
jgi:Cytochrome c7 and related cytochrome c